MMIKHLQISVAENSYAPSSERYLAYWGEPFSGADFWGSGPDPESAVRDLIDNYDVPDFPK